MAEGRPWWRKIEWRVLGSIFTLKICLLLLPAVTWPMMHGDIAPQQLGVFLAESWNRWDGYHYIRLAEEGYHASGEWATLIVFYPLYPLLIRLLALLTGHYVWSALIISNVAAIGGAYLFYQLVKLDYGPKVAWGSVAALLLFPTAYYFSAVYTEGLFLLLSVGSFLAARRGHWPWAGIIGSLAAFTRVTGVLLLPALMVEFWWQQREKKRSWLELMWLVPIAGAFGIYLLMNYQLLGSPWAFSEMLENVWFKKFAWPWLGVWWVWQRIGSFPYSSDVIMHGWLEFAAAMFAIIGSVWVLFRIRWSYGVYCLLVTWVILSTSFLLGTSRYVLSAFPLFIILGSFYRYRGLAAAWLLVSVMLLTLMAGLFTRGWWTV